MKKALLFAFVASGLISAQSYADQQTVDQVDLTRYVGTWYEIASIPQTFTKQCVGNTTAEYTSLPSGEIQVINSCDKSNGKRSVAEGRAKIVDTVTNAKLKVTFVKFFDWIYRFGGDYWIVGLEDNYRYAIVGHPTKEYAWILSRDPAMSKEDLLTAYGTLQSNGYDTCKIMTTIQTSGISVSTRLCDYVKGL